jgi:ABC-2 type transport system permease protein
VALLAVVMTGAYLALTGLTGLTGLGVGAIIRHSAAAAATLVGGLIAAPLITGAASRGTGKFMPELIAGNSLAAVKPAQRCRRAARFLVIARAMDFRSAGHSCRRT